MAYETTATLTAVMKQFYETLLLERAIPNLIHTQFGQKRDIPPNRGRSVEFRRFGALSAATTELTEALAPSPTAVTVTQVTATLAQYGAFHRYSDLLLLTSIDPYLQEISEVFGDQAGLTLDTIARNVLVAGTTVRYVGGVGSRGAVTASSIISSTEIQRALRDLKNQNAKPVVRNKYAALIHPFAEYDMFRDSTIVNAFQYAKDRGDDNPLFAGEIGEYMGFVFIESTNARIFTSLGATGADVYGALFMGANAYGITEIDGGAFEVIAHPPGSAGAADPLNQYGTVGWKAFMATTRLNENWLYRLEHGATP